MTLILSDADVARYLPMADCIEAMELAFREFAAGAAPNRPRQRFTCASPTEAAVYWANVHVGAVPGAGVAAVRIDSNLRTDAIGTSARMEFRKPCQRNWGQVILYSLETAEPVCIMPDFTLSGIRVGATTGLGARYLAPAGARTLAVLGTGKQARTNLEGVLTAVPGLTTVKVYSPNAEHRQAFAQEMTDRLRVEVMPVPHARAAIDAADIVCCATNANTPLFPGAWLRPGQLVVTIVNSDVVSQRTEVDLDTFLRSDVIVINDRESVEANNQRELLDPIADGRFGWDKVRELGAVVAGMAPGRRAAEEFIYYKNNSGLAIQFAAAGSVVYQRARADGAGHEIPTEWLGTELSGWYQQGYYPSS